MGIALISLGGWLDGRSRYGGKVCGFNAQVKIHYHRNYSYWSENLLCSDFSVAQGLNRSFRSASWQYRWVRRSVPRYQRTFRKYK